MRGTREVDVYKMEGVSEKEESIKLIGRTESNNCVASRDKCELSITRQRVLLASILAVQFFSFCADTIIYPFFPNIAVRKGLTNADIGLVFSAFDFPRFVSFPIFGSLVSVYNRNHPSYCFISFGAHFVIVKYSPNFLSIWVFVLSPAC